VVDPVKEEGDPLLERASRFEVKNEPVEEILRQCPNHHSDNNARRYEVNRVKPLKGVVNRQGDKISENRKIDHQNHCGMDMREKLQKIGFKKSDWFFIVYLFHVCI
jgi:hypothetical protein